MWELGQTKERLLACKFVLDMQVAPDASSGSGLQHLFRLSTKISGLTFWDVYHAQFNICMGCSNLKPELSYPTR